MHAWFIGEYLPNPTKVVQEHLLECAELEIQGTDAQASAPRYVPPNAHSAGPSAKLKNNAQIPTMKSRSTAAPGVWVRASGCHRHWFAGTHTRNVGQSCYVRLTKDRHGGTWNPAWSTEVSPACPLISTAPVNKRDSFCCNRFTEGIEPKPNMDMG